MYRSHEYSGLSDLAAMLGLVSASWKHDWPRNRFHVGDVWWFVGLGREETPDVPNPSIRLWTGDDGSVVGFAWLDGPDSGDVLVHRDRRRRGIEEEMLTWLEETHRLQAAPEEARPRWRPAATRTALAVAFGGEGIPARRQRKRRASLLAVARRAGAERSAGGVVVREVAGEHEATAARWCSARRSPTGLRHAGPTGGPQSAGCRTAEIERRTRIYRNIMRLPGYRRELDIVVEAANGDFAACCTCWLDSGRPRGRV